MRRLGTLLVGLVTLALLAGCAPRYAYHDTYRYDTYRYDTNGSGRVKGYTLADGTYVKVNPAFGTTKVNKGLSKKKRGR